MGNEVTCPIVDIGDMSLMTSTGCKLLLKVVRHVSEVRLNLLSTGRLDDESYTGIIQNRVMKFNKGSLIMARALKINTIDLMHARICREEVNMVADNVGELWLKRLYHMIQKGMWRLAEENLIPEVKNVQVEKSTDCLAGKQNQTSFRSRPPMRRKTPLELVHTDGWQVYTKSHAGL